MNSRLNPREASTYTGIPYNTLVDWRYDIKGPATYKLGSRWYYDTDELDRWMKHEQEKSARCGLKAVAQ